ncbi:Zn(2)-C6 fungal-type domain-containing protein [Trichoderma simmonsii]|uniref:Zn(2)-C6 fungal-type domain-containing protein n=1 Tax=Trichoderma simmonsii TaxID=1491479 RepID=A0A8G0PNI6_9HYPO|nr:Zn(2)-C6 fungal-type domain-containing protein [Trichoderma simmonsii]
MPVIRNIPDAKRRVRTGCLSCRKRRRKCDEGKPQCGSCQERNVVCKYPDLTFVIGPKLGAQEKGGSSSEQPASSYSNVRFVNNNSSSKAPIQSTEVQVSAQDEGLSLHVGESRPLLGPGDENILDSFIGSSSSQSKTASPFAAIHLPQSEWKDYFTTTHAASVKNETATLLHFQYNLAPWIEAGDVGSSFGTEIMLLAQKRRSILSAISSAASIQLARSNSAYGGPAVLQRDTDPSLALEEPRVRRIGLALLALGEVFTLNPSQWRRLSFFQSDESTRNTNSFSGFGEPLETLLRFHSRIDLAASLLTDQPPLTSLGFAMNHDPADRTLPLSTKSIYNACLIQLVSCLQLLNGNNNSSIASTSPPFYMSATQEPMSPTAGSYFSSKWSSLWSNCQQWYHSRPVEMQPILEIRSVEAGQIDADNDSSFPIPVYTSSIALQCNIVYHISSRLLLLRKPRLLRLSSRQRHLSSLSWHAQQIAGTATRNDFAEQWDPILIAGLLWIARDMTHPSQQESLISCFRQISSSTGIKLDEEIQALRARWNSSQARGYQLSG